MIGADIRRVQTLCREFVEAKKKGILADDVRFYASTSVRSLLGGDGGRPIDPELLLSELKEAGFLGLFIGVESGSDSQLARLRKGVSSADNLIVIQALRRVGLECDIGYIMFDPAATLEELEENLSFLRAAGLWTYDSRFTKRLRVIPKTALFETLDAGGSHSPSFDPNLGEKELPFTDWRVAAVYEAFRPWESRHLAQLLRLQGKARAARNETTRAAIKTAVARQRSQDLTLLAACTTAVATAQSKLEATRVLNDVLLTLGVGTR